MEIMKITQISINKMNMIAPISVHDFLFSAFYQTPISYLERTARKYGDISQVRLGRYPFFLINHPDYIHMILSDENDRFVWKACSKLNRYDKSALEVEQNLFSIIQHTQPEDLVISDQIRDDIIQTTRQFTNRWNVGQKFDINKTSMELSRYIYSLLKNVLFVSLNDEPFSLKDLFVFELVNNILYWCLFFLAGNQIIQENIPNQDFQKWFSHCEDQKGIEHYLSQFIILESLRLSPPVWMLSRIVQKEFDLGGFHFSEGIRILISPWTMQRDARYFIDPQRFDPFRWDPAFSLSKEDFRYFPFGNSNLKISQFTVFISKFFSLIIDTIFLDWHLVLSRKTPLILRPKKNFLFPIQDIHALREKR